MIQKVGIVGSGTMGCGVAQLCAQSGVAAALWDSDAAALVGAQGRVRAGLDAALQRGKLDASQKERAWGLAAPVRSIEDLADCGLVLEAIVEDLGVKQGLLARLSRLVPGAVLATNTSSFRVADVAARADFPERCVGLHFFNPPVAMKLVEVARAPDTSPEAFQVALDLALRLGRTPVAVRDTPGYIVNRVMRPYYLGAMREAGAAGGIAGLDRAAREHGKAPMGPFELMDLIGLDVNLAITRSIYEALGRPERLKPEAMQEKLVAAGHLGRKNGSGFYSYANGQLAGENPEAIRHLPRARKIAPEAVWGRLQHGIVLEAREAQREGVASADDIDLAVRLGTNFPMGPFEWLKKHAPAAPR